MPDKISESEITSSNVDAMEILGNLECAKCHPQLQIPGAILFPFTGLPQVLPTSMPEWVSIYVAFPAVASSSEYFRNLPGKEIKCASTGEPHIVSPTELGYFWVACQLRLYKLKSGKPKSEDVENKRFHGDDKYAHASKSKIGMWKIGKFAAGAVINIFGELVGWLSPRAVEWYQNNAKSGDPSKDGLSDIYQIVIHKSLLGDLSGGHMYTWAWMMGAPKPETGMNYPEFQGATSLDYTDLIVQNYLHGQEKDDYAHHFDPLYEMSLPQSLSSFVLSPDAQYQHRLISWHPVIARDVKKIAHVADVHINASHNAMRMSPVAVLDNGKGGSDRAPAGDCELTANSLCVASEAFYDLLVNQIGKEQNAVTFLTGDLLDYNLNIDPKLSGMTVTEQWKHFNVMGNLHTQVNGQPLYRRGFDDMMAYSIVLAAMRKDMPVYITSGNHERYQFPFGISPRVNAHAFAMGIDELNAVRKEGGYVSIEGYSEIAARQLTATAITTAVSIALKYAVPMGWIVNETFKKYYIKPVAKALSQVVKAKKLGDFAYEGVAGHFNKKGNYTPGNTKHEYASAELEAASKFIKDKANEGIPADHNLTIYEACLIWGPTYAQTITSQNFKADKIDWFQTVFSPLTDWNCTVGQNTFCGLSWGESEVILNPIQFQAAGTSGLNSLRIEKQGQSFLPRAPNNFSDDQLKVIKAAQFMKLHNGGKLMVMSHFTLINFGNGLSFEKAFDNKHLPSFCPLESIRVASIYIQNKDRKIYSDMVATEADLENGEIKFSSKIWDYLPTLNEKSAGWNVVNIGTCEKNLPWYFDNCVNSENAGVTAGIDYHFTGHSHRAGVYTVTRKQAGTLQYRAEGATNYYEVTTAFDPGFPENPHTQKYNNNQQEATRFVVTSSGGPHGIQNLNDEMAGGVGKKIFSQTSWLLRPPSALLMDIGSGKFKQLEANHVSPVKKAKTSQMLPQLRVGLDYMHVMQIEDPIYFCMRMDWTKGQKLNQPAKIAMLMGRRTHTLDCIKEVKLWGYKVQESKGMRDDGGAGSGTWTSFPAFTLKELSGSKAYPRMGNYVWNSKKNTESPFLFPSEWLAEGGKTMDGFTILGKAEDDYVVYEATVPAELMSADTNTTFTKWFVGAGLKPPAGYGGIFANRFDTGTWFYPVEVKCVDMLDPNRMVAEDQHASLGASLAIARRPIDDPLGEVPDYDWLGKATSWFRYPRPKEVIRSGATDEQEANARDGGL